MYLVDHVTIGFVAILLIGPESNSHDLVLSHEELGVGKGLAQRFEVVGRHVVEGQDVDVFEATHEGMHLVDDELFVLSGLGGHLGQRNHFVLLGLRHQQ